MFIFLLQILGIIFLSVVFTILIVIICLIMVYRTFNKHYDKLNEAFKDEWKKQTSSK